MLVEHLGEVRPIQSKHWADTFVLWEEKIISKLCLISFKLLEGKFTLLDQYKPRMYIHWSWGVDRIECSYCDDNKQRWWIYWKASPGLFWVHTPKHLSSGELNGFRVGSKHLQWILERMSSGMAFELHIYSFSLQRQPTHLWCNGVSSDGLTEYVRRTIGPPSAH